MHKINKQLYRTTRLERHWGDKYIFVWLVVHLLNKRRVISPILCVPILSQLEPTHLSAFLILISNTAIKLPEYNKEFLTGYLSTQIHSHEIMKGLQIS